jgi:hypothetical protein
MPQPEDVFKAMIVHLILSNQSEDALHALSRHYSVAIPHLTVGMPKKHHKHMGCYVTNTQTIHVQCRDYLTNPFVILHEFYHHLRTRGREHRGTEKYANTFAHTFIEAFNTIRGRSTPLTERWGGTVQSSSVSKPRV